MTTGTESVQDFVARLAEQLAFLDASADGYDRGVESEAIRLAATIRVLVHDGRPPSRSLLSHLQVRDRLPWTDTVAGEIRESALSVGSGLSMMRMSADGSGTSTFQPLLGQLPPERIHPAAAFVDWWNDPVLSDADGTSYNRRSLVLWVTNKEGGAHVDESLPSAYAALTRENSIGITQVPVPYVNGSGLGFSIAPTTTGITRQRLDGPPLENSCVLANIRQIAWELRDTLRRHLVVAAPGVFVRAPICPLSIHDSPRPDRRGACACGSGRRFELCFGLRLPRRTFSLAELGAHDAT
jgi:hypothetical protein